MNAWGWKFDRTRGDGRFGTTWSRALVIVVPFVTVGLLLLMLHVVGGTLTTAKGVLFDLPSVSVGDEAATDAVALLVPMRHETVVFFDDDRYAMGSAASMRSLEERLAERLARSAEKTLLVLADRRVPCGDLMDFAARARRSGVGKLLFAEKNAGEGFE